MLRCARNDGLMLVVLLLVMLWPSQISAQSGLSIIRDTEIEAIFAEWTAPILKTANIPADNVRIILVQSPQINAFVAGGSNVFFYTGLLEATDGPGEILGVFAHELGHIAGSHLIKTRDALERASYESILGTVLGLGAAILTGDGGAAAAGSAAGSSVAQRRFLAHSRVHESAADQAALRYFEGAGFNPGGLGSFLEKLQDEELLPASRQSEYVRTHPLTRDRVETVKAAAAKSQYRDAQFPAAWIEQHARMNAKLIGFIDPGRVPWEYDDRDNSIPARYARTIADYRQNRIPSALEGINALITEEPQNPYFHELKGQMLVDFSRVEEGIAPYRQAIKLKPDAALFRIALAHALIESGDNQPRLQEAIDHLERAQAKEPRSTRVHRLLATAYGRLGQNNLAKIHLAEEAVLQRRVPYAKRMAEAVLAASPNEREALKAKDVLNHIKTLKSRNN